MVLRRARSLWNQLIDYYRPIPNPIDYEKHEMFTWEKLKMAIKETKKQYIYSWRYTLGIDQILEEHRLKKERERLKKEQEKLRKEQKLQPEKELDLKELGDATRDLIPTVTELLVTRTQAYRESLKQFVAGYKEALNDNSPTFVTDLSKQLESHFENADIEKRKQEEAKKKLMDVKEKSKADLKI